MNQKHLTLIVNNVLLAGPFSSAGWSFEYRVIKIADKDGMPFAEIQERFQLERNWTHCMFIPWEIWQQINSKGEAR